MLQLLPLLLLVVVADGNDDDGGDDDDADDALDDDEDDNDDCDDILRTDPTEGNPSIPCESFSWSTFLHRIKCNHSNFPPTNPMRGGANQRSGTAE